MAANEIILKADGSDICAGEWGKPLGEGLYEFRIRKSLRTILAGADRGTPEVVDADRPVLLRVFCTFYGDKIVLLYHGYNKRTDPSQSRQRRENAKARKLHSRWKRHRNS